MKVLPERRPAAVFLRGAMAESDINEKVPSGDKSAKSGQIDWSIKSNADYVNAVPNTNQSTKNLVDIGTLPALELTTFDTATGFIDWRNPFEKPISVGQKLEPVTADSARKAIDQMGLKASVVPGINGQPDTTTYYLVGTDGDKIPVLKSDKPIEQQYVDLIAERDRLMKETESRFGIDIKKTGTVDAYGKTIAVQLPTLQQIIALRESLEHSQPSQLQPDGSKIEVRFLAEDLPNGVVAFYSNGKPHSLTVGKNKDSSYSGVVQTLNHEFAHSGQLNDDSLDSALAAAEGFRKVGDMYILEGKNPGEFYRVTDYQHPYDWIRCNADGVRIKADGTLAKPHELIEEPYLESKVVRERARIRPATYYFPTPDEENAEALSYLRMGENQRQALYFNDPELYRVTQKFDQDEIDRAYGKNKDGTPKFIRSSKGLLVENTPQNQEKLKEWEYDNLSPDLWQNRPQDPLPSSRNPPGVTTISI